VQEKQVEGDVMIKIQSLICLFICFIIATPIIQAKLLVFTHSYNRPDFIEIQYKTFKKFLHDEYEFIVFNDGSSEHDARSIENICTSLGIACIRIPQEIHDRPYLFRLAREGRHSPCVRCANVVQYSLNEYGFKHDDLVMIIDSDMFLIKDFSVRDFLHGFALAGLDQERAGYHYLWNGLVFMDVTRLAEKETLNFNCGELFGVPVDVGGNTYYYMRAHPEVKVRYFDEINLIDLRCQKCQRESSQDGAGRIFRHICTHNSQVLERRTFDPITISFIQQNIYNSQFLVNNSFFHYRSGTNWDGQPAHVHAIRTQVLRSYIDALLAK
jgi:hypothetical protein